MNYPLDMPRRRTHRRPWWYWPLVIAIVVPVAFAVDSLDSLVTFAAMWVLTQFGVDAPFWPTFVGVLLIGLMTGNGSRR